MACLLVPEAAALRALLDGALQVMKGIPLAPFSVPRRGGGPTSAKGKRPLGIACLTRLSTRVRAPSSPPTLTHPQLCLDLSSLLRRASADLPLPGEGRPLTLGLHDPGVSPFDDPAEGGNGAWAAWASRYAPDLERVRAAFAQRALRLMEVLERGGPAAEGLAGFSERLDGVNAYFSKASAERRGAAAAAAAIVVRL